MYEFRLPLHTSFLESYIKNLVNDKKYVYSNHISGDYSILWSRDNYETIFFNLIDFFFANQQEFKIWRGGEILKGIFSYKKGKKEFQERIDNLIKKYIETCRNDKEKIVFIFQLIAEFSYEKRIEFILFFINKNNSFEIFNKLSFNPSTNSWSGSRVPYLQKDKDFYTSLLQNMKGIKFLEHRQKIENYISYIEQDIKNEMKSDFMDDY